MKKKTGFTLMEMCVAVALSSMIMTMVMVIMNRTTRHYKKGTELMNVQTLMDNLTERLRNDIKGLKDFVEPPTEKKISFRITDISDNTTAIDSNELTVTYEVEETGKQTRDGKALYKITRTQGNKTTSMHSENQIKYIKFDVKPKANPDGTITNVDKALINAKNFGHIEMSMQLISDVNGQGGYSTMSFICNFFSNCLDNQL